MTPKDFANLADLLRRRSGLALTPDKKTLAKARLKPVAELFGFRDTNALYGELPYPSEELARAITEAMTTNETSFFRDPAVFDHLSRSILPELARARSATKRLRIWCAAVSTGQEAYSLASVLEDTGLLARGWKLDLLATDLNEESIRRAKEGLYAPYEIERGLSLAMRDRWLVPEGGQWRVTDRLRRMVTFRSFNLLDHFGWLGELDIVVCRNVLLYLDSNAKAQVQTKLARAIASDGYLVLGENESASEEFVSLSGPRSFYVKPRGLRTQPQRLAV